VAFLFTKTEQTEKEIRETILLTIASNKIKYLGINLTKEVKDLFNEDYNNEERSCRKQCSCISRINVIKISSESNLQIH
jgi:hypothetical protein